MKLKYYTKKKLRQKIDEYIAQDSVKSIAGLALYLGVDRSVFGHWLREGDERLSDILNYARTCIEKDVVENGLKGKYNATMASFILKTSFGYRDRGGDISPEPVKIEVADELMEYAN